MVQQGEGSSAFPSLSGSCRRETAFPSQDELVDKSSFAFTSLCSIDHVWLHCLLLQNNCPFLEMGPLQIFPCRLLC